MVKIKQGGRVAHHADFFSAITHHVNEVQLQLVNNISSLEWISSKLLSGSFGGWKVCVYVCASSFKWYSPITEIYKEINASRVVNIENHAPYSRKGSYAQSRLTRLICARSRISLIVCDPSRNGIPLCHPDEKTLHSHLGRASILVLNPLTFIPFPFPIRRSQRRL